MAPAKQKNEKDYDDLPGTVVFDADQARKGYHLNMFCMSLMKAENRAAFKDDERAYLDQWPLTRGPEAGDPQARLERHARARRQHLLHREARRDRRPSVPADRRHDDGLDPGRTTPR